MPSHTSPPREKSYRGFEYCIEHTNDGFAVFAWPKGRLEDRATAHYFSRRTDAARWLQAAIRRLAERKQGE